MDALRGQKRDKAIVVPRQIAMFLMREETDSRCSGSARSWAAGTTPRSSTRATRSTARSQVNDDLRREVAAVRELIYTD